MATVSPTPPHPALHQMRHSPLHGGASGASPVRLPPVSLPREDFLQPATFNPNRRVSITDPFLHAYPAVPDPSSAAATEAYMGGAPLGPGRAANGGNGMRRSSDESAGQPASSKGGLPTSRPGSPGGGGGMGPNQHHQNQQRYGSGPTSGYDFGYGAGGGGGRPNQGVPSPFPPPGSHPNHTYRFGGPPTSQAGGGGGMPNEGPSYFDYSMRRHSLTNANGGQHSPPRLPAIESAPSPGVKRKTSIEDSIAEEAYPYSPSNAYPSHVSANGPYPKRRGSGMTYDKLGNLSLGDQSRRDSMASTGGMSAWDEERRGSGTSYGSVGSQSQGYMSSYGAPSPGDPFDQRMGSFSSQHQPPPHHSHRHPSLSESMGYDQQAPHPSSRHSSLSMAPPPPSHHQHHQSMDADLAYQQGRRLSAPNQQIQQQQGGMVFGAPGGGAYPNNGRTMSQPSMLSSVAPSPPDSHDPRGPPPQSNASGLPPAQAAWARAGPLPASAHHHLQSRNNSTSSLDPASAYGPGGSKDIGGSPYSRSPELRVSHKLAERKRRKEMAQLFDELRDALPVDRGLKSSKWEILSKAVDYIISLKEHNSDLARDNTMLRDHFGLGPGPQASNPGMNTSPSENAPQVPYTHGHGHGPIPSGQVSPLSVSPRGSSAEQQGQPPPDSWQQPQQHHQQHQQQGQNQGEQQHHRFASGGHRVGSPGERDSSRNGSHAPAGPGEADSEDDDDDFGDKN